MRCHRLSRGPLLCLLLAGLTCVGRIADAQSHLSPLPPLGSAAAPGGAKAAPPGFGALHRPLPPVLLAQAEQAPAPPPSESADQAPKADDKTDRPAGDKAAATARSDDQADDDSAARADTGECRRDADCPAGAGCVAGFCKSKQPRTSALFYFHQPGPIGFRVVVPFYFSFWRPQVKTRVIAPFYIDRQNQAEKTRDIVLPPLLYQYHREPGVVAHRVWPVLFYSDYGKQGGGFGLLPLFYASRRGEKTNVVLPPLLSFYRSDAATRSRQGLLLGLFFGRQRGDNAFFAAIPLLTFYRQREDLRELFLLGGLGYARRTPKSEFGLALVLGWYHRTEESLRAGVFPLAWHKSTEERSSTVVLPLFFQSHDRTTGIHQTTLFPLFHYRRDDEQGRRLWVTPLGGHYTDALNGVTVTALVVPPLIHRDTPRRRITVIPPLAVWWANKETGQSAGYTGPFFWSQDDTGSTAGVAPLYFRFHDNRTGGSTHILLPVGGLHKSPGRFFGMLGPLYAFSRRTGDDPGVGGGLAPLLMFGTGKTSYLFLLPPVLGLYRNRDTGQRHVSVGPLFYRDSRDGYDTGLMPLLFIGRRQQTSYQALLPLFFHSKSPSQERVVVGPLYVERTTPKDPTDPRAGVSAGLFPLLFVKHTAAQSYAVVPPLFWWARDGVNRREVGVFGPVFYQREPGRVIGGLFPLAYYRKDAYEHTLLSPIAAYHKNRDHRLLAVGPYFDLKTRDSSTRALFPVAFFYRSPTASADVVFPLFLQAREGDSTVRSVALLYWGVHRPGVTAHVLPIGGYVDTSRSTTVALGPLFYHRRHDGSGQGLGLLPLFGYGSNERLTAWATPVGFYYNNKQTHHIRSSLLLFYGDFRENRADWGVFPLLFGRRRGTSTAVLGPLFFHSHDDTQDRSLTVAGPLYYGHETGARSFGLFPLLFAKTQTDGSYRVVLAPLFLLQHREGKTPLTRFFTPLFGYSRDPGGFRAYLGTAYLRRDAEYRSEALLPIFYHGYNVTRRSSTWLLFPLLYQHKTPESTLTAVTPLFWQYSSLTSSVMFGFPFLLDVHNRFHNRLTAIGPLAIRARSYSENTTSWIFPPILTYVKRHAEGHHDAVVFPLFWHFSGADRSTSVLFPIFYHLRRPTYTGTVLFPIFGRLHDDEGTTWLIPPLLTYAHTGRDGRSSAMVFPVFWHSKTLERQTTVFFPLVWHLRRPTYQSTVFAPVGAHWRNPKGAYTLVFNMYVYRGGGLRRGAWDFHLWPLFSVGRPQRTDLEWNVLGGLIGFSRSGADRRLRLLWGIWIPLSATQPTAHNARPALLPTAAN